MVHVVDVAHVIDVADVDTMCVAHKVTISRLSCVPVSRYVQKYRMEIVDAGSLFVYVDVLLPQ